jgi:hypothetical protein
MVSRRNKLINNQDGQTSLTTSENMTSISKVKVVTDEGHSGIL